MERGWVILLILRKFIKMRILTISDYSGFNRIKPEPEVFIGLAKKGFEVHVMTLEKAHFYKKRFEAVGVKVIDFHPEKKFDKEEIKKIRTYLIEYKIDILHLFNNTSIINGLRAAKGLPVKVILYRGMTGNIHWYDPTAYLKFLHSRVDKIWCNSEGVEELFHQQLFFDKKKTIIINKGHKIDWYENIEPHNIKKELGLPPETFVVVNSANNRKMKGIPWLLKAISLLSSDLPIALLLVGKNMEDAENKKVLDKMKNRSMVHILGYRKDVLNIVAGADTFALPSIYGESITKSVMEAMGLGVAPIITDIPGNRELVVNGESGLVVPMKNSQKMADAILKFYHNPDLKKLLARNAKTRIATRFTQERTIEKLIELYGEMSNQK